MPPSAPTSASLNTTLTSKSTPAAKKQSQPPRANSGVRLPPGVLAGNATPAVADQDAGPGKQPQTRRRPKKLGKPIGSTAAPAPVPGQQQAGPSSAQSSTLNAEVEALKARINQLEGQVEELYNRPGSTNSPVPEPAVAAPANKPPRRRGRGRGPPPPESLEELQRLEAELEATQQELAGLNLKKGATGTASTSQRPTRTPLQETPAEDEIEEIPRGGAPVAESQNQGKSVTLTGSYRIPLPSSVSMDDVKSIQSGINSANSIARGLLESHRAQKATATTQNKPVSVNASTEVAKQGDKQTWSDWIGGYSMSVAKLVKDMEAEAAIEETPSAGSAKSKRPAANQRLRSSPAATASGKTAASSSPGNTKPQRPSLKQQGSGSGARLSQQEVQTLLA